MNVTRLLQLKRYFRCRKLFRSPLRSHWKTASVFRNQPPASLTFLDGTTVTLEEPRRYVWLWNIVLGSGDATSVSAEGGVLSFLYRGKRVEIKLDEPESARAFRRMVVELGGDILPMLSRGDNFIVHWDGEPITLSLKSRTSWSTFAEVFIDDCYHVRDIPKELDTVVDLGCNVGMFAMRMYPIAKRIVSIDAIDGVLKVAKENLERNSRTDKVTLLQYAVSDQSGQTIKLWTGPEGTETTTSSVDADLAGHFGNQVEVEVETISLPDLFEKQDIDRCDLLKIDIETAEFNLFKGIDDETLSKVDRIVMEAHIWGKQEYADRYAEIQKRLADSGFELNAGSATKEDGSLVNVTYLLASRQP